MEVLNESIYDHPKYYDLVFGSDCAAEVKFILACGEQYLSKPPTRFFEPACGTGRLLFALAKRGFEASGLDLNEKAIEFCNDRFQRHGLPQTAFVADMADFKVPHRHDIGFNTINSFRHLDSESGALAHLRCMADAISIGGLYLLGVHLTPTEVPPTETESWTASRGQLSIRSHMWTNERDTRRRVERFGIQFDVRIPSRRFRIADELVLRSYTFRQFDRLINAAPHWQIVGSYDFRYDVRRPVEVDGTSEDVVYVLQRQ